MMEINKQRKRVIRLELSVAGDRLDQELSDHCPELSRTLSRKLIDVGGVHLNGRRVRKCSLSTKAGDNVEIFIDGFPLKHYRIREQDVILQDDYIIVINKPPLIESQPTPARYKGTLYEALLLWLQNPYRPHHKPTIGMVQRLDRDTSGVMIFSSHCRSHKALTASFTQREAKKKYLALISGHLLHSDGEFSSTLARNRATNKMKSVEKGGKLAITRFRCIHQFETCTLVEVDIPTGRMHQIRVHFSEAGHPLVGDVRYGYLPSTVGAPVHRTMLHSWTLECSHPVTKKTLCVSAPVAYDFQQLLTFLGGCPIIGGVARNRLDEGSFSQI
ncbi:MAG: RluA family pseudouridine synthase [Thermodesulfobacteriota bacterium]|nr:RluA family pseudouridine synthase [Thermodesulfobacteriota bacterium]